MVHFIWQVNMYDPPQKLPLPRVINLLTDLKEERDATACSTWVVEPAVKIVGAFQHSLNEFPPIPAGTPDPYVPRK
jgi:arylsulfatase